MSTMVGNLKACQRCHTHFRHFGDTAGGFARVAVGTAGAVDLEVW